MKLFGYKEETGDQDQPVILSEVSILTSPEELKQIANLLEQLVAEMENNGFDHVHLSDRLPSLRGGPDLIVVKAEQ